LSPCPAHAGCGGKAYILFDTRTVILFLIGLAAGVISGMGMGGGAILIPALVLAINPEQHIAQSVNLLFFVPTAVIALIIHIKNKRIDFKMAWPIIIFGLCGAFLGSLLAARLGGGQLKKLFGWFLIAMSVYEMFRKGKQEKQGEQGKQAKQAKQGRKIKQSNREGRAGSKIE
jgi:uncharacterized membrane protein YfcA